MINVASDLPDIADVLKATKIKPQRVLAYELPTDTTEFDPLVDAFISKGGTLVTRSTARFEDGTFRLETTINVIVADGTEPVVFAPALLALKKSPDVQSFVAHLPKFWGVKFIRDGDVYRTRKTFEVKGKSKRAPLFIVNHPVTVVTPNWSTCVTVASYSPFPVHIADDFCLVREK